MNRKILPAAALLVIVGAYAGLRGGTPDTSRKGDGSLEASFADFVRPDGSVRLPQRDYRSVWAHLGTFVVPGGEPAKGFHDVYTQPEAVEAFGRLGRFPDGTVLIKEVRSMETATLTTGDAGWAGEPAQWFVMIRDEQGRFADHPLWDKGWGWALFEATDPTVNVATSFGTDCRGCHLPARATDWIFVQGYPAIREAYRKEARPNSK